MDRSEKGSKKQSATVSFSLASDPKKEDLSAKEKDAKKKREEKEFTRQLLRNLTAIITAGMVLATTLAFSDMVNEILFKITGVQDTLWAYIIYFVILAMATVLLVYTFTRIGGKEVAETVLEKV
jgi:polyferredoxin